MTKPEYVYPGSDLDRSKTLVSLLGSFWARTYTGVDQVRSYTDTAAFAVAQSHRNLLELVAAMSRYEVPLFHTEVITPIVLRKSTVNRTDKNRARFNRGKYKFDGGVVFDTHVGDNFFTFPAAEKLANVGQIFDKITFPTLTLLNNVDYFVDRDTNTISFVDNPFDNPGFARAAVTVDGVTDEEIVLWGFMGQFDYEYVLNQFAYALGIQLKTSQNYKDLINAIFSSLLDGGATVANLDAALAAICGVPVVASPTETVEVIEQADKYTLIITDRNVYRFAADVVPRVNIGQTVRAGDQLIRGVEVNEFFVGNAYLPNDDDRVTYASPTKLLVNHAYENIAEENDSDIILDSGDVCPPPLKPLAGLALDKHFLAACFYGDLVFENRVVPLHVNTDHPTGYTYVHFELNGFPADVARFFDEVHARGIVAAAQRRDPCRPGRRIGTLAHLLDKRNNPDGEPRAEHLPAEINPLRFLIENVLRNNVFVVRINTAALGQNRLGLYNVRHLRQVIPPQTAMIVVFELAPPTETIDAEDFVSEQAVYFKGIEPQTDTIDENYVQDLGALLTRLSGTCQ